jgi:hypothetical protein
MDLVFIGPAQNNPDVRFSKINRRDVSCNVFYRHCSRQKIFYENLFKKNICQVLTFNRALKIEGF